MDEFVKQTAVWLRNPQFLRRVVALCGMVLIIWIFRHLSLLLISFFLASQGMQWLAKKLALLFRGNQRLGLLMGLLLLITVFTSCALLLVHFGASYAKACSVPPTANGIFQHLKEVRAELIDKLPACLPIDTLLDRLLLHTREFAELHGTVYANVAARALLYIVIGLIVALVYLFDQKRVDDLIESADSSKFFGILRDYFHFWGEAILITVKLQVIVALVNTILTLPVLLLLHLPHLPFLIAVIFVSSLIPIMGNFISGAVLVVYSYLHKGLGSVAIFLVITAILHKVEAYYLNPRLSSKHVQLPTLILIFSLITFEYLFGWVGIFLSFPCLYVAIKITQDMKRVLASSEKIA